MDTYEVKLVGDGYGSFIDVVTCWNQSQAIDIMRKKWPGYAIGSVTVKK